MSDQDDRVTRLVGGRDVKGGGLPLPDVFRAVVRLLLNHGPSRSDMIVKVVTDSIGRLQARRVESIWESWEDFTEDILDQLIDAGLVSYDDTEELWQLTDLFQSGYRHQVIPRKANGRGGTWIEVESIEGEKKRSATMDAIDGIRRARRILTESGAITDEVDVVLRGLLSLLNVEVPPSKRIIAAGYLVGYPEPPDDQPGASLQCTGDCQRELPLTRENFDVYYHARNEKYYWRRRCVECFPKAELKRVQERRDRVHDAMARLVNGDTEVEITPVLVSRTAGVNVSDVKRDWVWLRKRHDDVPWMDVTDE